MEKLIELIATLNKGEKRYFNRYIQLHSDEKSSEYRALYDYINKQLAKSDASSNLKKAQTKKLIQDVKEKFKHKTGLTSTSNYLQSILRKSLRNYYSYPNTKSSADIGIQECLIDIEIFLNKGMPTNALSRINEAEKLAAKHDKVLKLLELKLLKRSLKRMSYGTGEKKAKELLGDLQKECHTMLINLRAFIKASDVHERVFLEMGEVGSPSEEILKSPERILLEEQPEIAFTLHSLGFSTKISYMLAQANLNLKLKNYEKSYLIYEEIIHMFNEKKQLRQEEMRDYIISINNYLSISAKANNYNQFEPYLEKIKDIKTKNENIEALMFEHYYYQQLNYLLRPESTPNDHKKALELIPKIRKGLETHNKLIRDSRKLVFYLSISTVQLLNGQIEEADKWNLKIINFKNRKNIRYDVVLYSKILQIVLYFEELIFHRLTNRELFEQNREFLKSKLINKFNKHLRNENKKERISDEDYYTLLDFSNMIVDLSNVEKSNNKRKIIITQFREKLQNSKSNLTNSIDLWLGKKIREFSREVTVPSRESI